MSAKLSRRPSPRVARLLRALRDDTQGDGKLIVHKNFLYAYVSSWPRIEDKCRKADARMMLQYGWVTMLNNPNQVEAHISWHDEYKISEAGIAAIADMQEEDYHPPPKLGLDSGRVFAALRYHYCPPNWEFIEELRLSTGFSGHYVGNELINPQRRMDALAINCNPSKRHEVRVFEVKVERGDLRSELDDPMKRRSAMALANTFYFVAPKGMMKDKELPENTGLIEYDTDLDFVKVKHRAPWLENDRPSWGTVASIARNLRAYHYDKWKRKEL